MPASPGDEAQQFEARSIGGLAGVFRGLTGSKSTKLPPAQQTLGNVSQIFPPDEADAASASAHILPPEHMDMFRQLRNGSINERIAAASTLRFAVADYPLAPVRFKIKRSKTLLRCGS
jgi:hypothetical protein